MDDRPLVSVIMPNYNGAKFLGQAISSVQKQTLRDWELLFIDDGSTDDSVSLVEKIQALDPRVKLLKTTFKKLAHGPGAARNTGIESARGRYIAFLDSDDLWLPMKLEKQLAFMNSRDSAFSFGWYEVIDENGQLVSEKKPAVDSVNYSKLLRDCIIGCLTAVYDSEKLDKQFINLHPQDRFADYSLWLKILKITPRADCLHEFLGQYRLVGRSISANKLKAAEHNWHLLRNVEGLSFLSAVYYFTWYVVKGLTLKLGPWIKRGLQGRQKTLVRSE